MVDPGDELLALAVERPGAWVAWNRLLHAAHHFPYAAWRSHRVKRLPGHAGSPSCAGNAPFPPLDRWVKKTGQAGAARLDGLPESHGRQVHRSGLPSARLRITQLRSPMRKRALNQSRPSRLDRANSRNQLVEMVGEGIVRQLDHGPRALRPRRDAHAFGAGAPAEALAGRQGKGDRFKLCGGFAQQITVRPHQRGKRIAVEPRLPQWWHRKGFSKSWLPTEVRFGPVA